MLRLLAVLLYSLLVWTPAQGQSVFDVLPQTPSGSFSTQVTLPDASSWRTTGLQLSAGTTLTFPELSTWNSTGLTLASGSTLRLPDGSSWTRTALQLSAITALQGPDSSTWNSTGLSIGPGKQLYLSNGTSSAPAMSFGSQATAGWYREGTDDLRLVLSGSIPALRAYKSGVTGLVSVPFGSSTAQATVGGTACKSTTSAPTTGTTIQVLATCSIPASALSVDGMGLKVKAWGQTAANGNNKVLEIFFGATMCASLTSAVNNGAIIAETTILRTGAATQECAGMAMSGTGGAYAMRAAPAEDTTTTIALTVKGTTPTASGDLTFKGLTVEVLN